MIAYRIQYEPLNRQAQKAVRAKTYGATQLIQMVNTQNQAHDQQWRHKKALAGGGALPNIGLYCLNTTRYLLGEKPIEVSAQLHSTPGDARFKEVEENVTFTLRFPSGVIAQCPTDYGSFNSRAYTVHAETGSIKMDPAFPYHGLHLEYVHAPDGKQLKETPNDPMKNQFALEMDHLAECVRQSKLPHTPGEEGLQDQRIMEAIYQSARENKPGKLPAGPRLDAFRGPAPAADEASGGPGSAENAGLAQHPPTLCGLSTNAAALALAPGAKGLGQPQSHAVVFLVDAPSHPFPLFRKQCWPPLGRTRRLPAAGV